MEWSTTSPDLNPIENLCSDMKMELCDGGKQYNCKADQSEVIKTRRKLNLLK